jgi:uncharacterized protein
MADRGRLQKRIQSLKSQDAGRRAAPRGPERLAPPFPGWERVGEFVLSRTVRIRGGAVRPWPRDIAPEAREPGELLFFDTETTGLSGGAGSVIFLMGTAWCEDGDLVLEQLFLADFPGEAEFLAMIKERFSRFSAFVSYNGKAFDSRLLSTRFVMNRIEFEMGHQIDLLHLSRRLWRGVTGDYTLRTIETRIMGITRGVDVASEEIPSIYFEFLRRGEPGLLPVVFEHNLTDVTSLARMWDSMGELLQGHMDAVPVDARALGSLLMDRSFEIGVTILSETFSRGAWDAGMPLSLGLKKRGEWEKAAEVWFAMVQEGRSVFAAVELSKYREHRLKDPEKALESVETLLSWKLPLDARTRREIQKRRERLLKKVARLGQ